jgi:hypothetical protein
LTLVEILEQITPLPWCGVETDSSKVTPMVRLFSQQRRGSSKEICFGRIDSVRDARYTCHAANVLPDVVRGLALLLEDQKRAKSELSRAQFEFCESALTKAETIHQE